MRYSFLATPALADHLAKTWVAFGRLLWWRSL